MDTTFIYALRDPNSHSIRYIGKADHPDTDRLPRHLRNTKSHTHKNCWIRQLASKGLRPELLILKEVPMTEWQEWERRYIRSARALGFDLTNGSDGGEGVCNPSAEVREKRRQKLLGIPRSEETKRKVSDSKKGCKAPQHSEEILNKISRSLRNRKKPNNVSGFVGVSWHKITGKWAANFRAQRKQKHVGIFSKLEDAVFARALALYNYEN